MARPRLFFRQTGKSIGCRASISNIPIDCALIHQARRCFEGECNQGMSQIGGQRPFAERRERAGSGSSAAAKEGPVSALTRRSYSCSALVGDRPATIGIGAKVVGHARSVAFKMAEVAISKNRFAEILRMIASTQTDGRRAP